jgi:hypothetical protein
VPVAAEEVRGPAEPVEAAEHELAVVVVVGLAHQRPLMPSAQMTEQTPAEVESDVKKGPFLCRKREEGALA